MAYLFTSESVSEGHPDKVADQVSDAMLDAYLRQDPDSKVACETLVTTGLVVLAGEVRSNSVFNHQEIVRNVINQIGYNKAEYKFDAGSCGILSTIHEQSSDIHQGVERGSEDSQGAGDQGMMFGYANKETDYYMPLPIELSHLMLKEMADIRKEGKQMTYLRPDSKSQVTVEYGEDHNPIRIHTIVVSTQHDEFSDDDNMISQIKEDIRKIVLPRVMDKLSSRVKALFDGNYILHVNPTGKFVIGGPHGDTGLTGRKIIVDTYGGKGAHGGGAFSGKDSSKVDRSAAYATRHIAKNLVAAGVADEVMVQLAYAIGIADPVGLYINTFGSSNVNMSDSKIADKVQAMFDLRPGAIVRRFGLRNPIFQPTASYGHFGRHPYKEMVKLVRDAREVEQEVEFFAWEKLDYVDQIKNTFGI